jgi:peptidoglycan/xylan/chitin deacetylase (PgdA/CDA1 family)
LLSLVFHGTLPDEQLHRGVLDPRYCLSVHQFRQCVEYYLAQGFRAVAPRDVLAGLAPDGRYVMFVFDDGYFNNSLVLPVLEEYRVPAVFAIPTDVLTQSRAYWWDVLYRCRTRAGVPTEDVWAEIDRLLTVEIEQIESRIRNEFGHDVLQTEGDLDRPFRVGELRDFARHDLVTLANHTHTHPYLPACSAERIEAEIARAQEILEQISGVRPEAIVYPFGRSSPEAIIAARRAGLHMGFCCQSRKQRLPLNLATQECMTLPRFLISATEPIVRQCERTRLDWRLSRLVRSLVQSEDTDSPPSTGGRSEPSSTAPAGY